MLAPTAAASANAGTVLAGHHISDGAPVRLPAGPVLVVGAAGSGKTTLAARFAYDAYQRGDTVWVVDRTGANTASCLGIAARVETTPAGTAVALADAVTAGMTAVAGGTRVGLCLVVEDADALADDADLAGRLRCMTDAYGPAAGITVVMTAGEPAPELLAALSGAVFTCIYLHLPSRVLHDPVAAGLDLAGLPTGAGFVVADGVRADAVRFEPLGEVVVDSS